MNAKALRVEDAHPELARLLGSSGAGRVVQRMFGKDSVELIDQCRRQGLGGKARDLGHCPVVVQDHPLAAVAGRSAGAEHLLGDASGGGGAFELARCDRLLDERADEVSAPIGRLGHLFAH